MNLGPRSLLVSLPASLRDHARRTGGGAYGGLFIGGVPLTINGRYLIIGGR